MQLGIREDEEAGGWELGLSSFAHLRLGIHWDQFLSVR